jgi:hypothetical protein
MDKAQMSLRLNVSTLVKQQDWVAGKSGKTNHLFKVYCFQKPHSCHSSLLLIRQAEPTSRCPNCLSLQLPLF